LGVFAYNFRFPGQYYDAESGLFYNMARDYNSTLGRYMESDPIGLSGGINTYGYATANPLVRLDPFGLVTIFFGGFGDSSTSHIVYDYFNKYVRAHPGQRIFYEPWDVNPSAVEALIKSEPKSDPINLIGHSYGGDTAAEIAVQLANSRPVSVLVTADPVSHFPPNFNDIEASVGYWYDINAVGGGSLSGCGNFIAGLGGYWGHDPAGIASQFIDVPWNHCAFANMMSLTPFGLWSYGQ
jgi:RHS repeat-associated protein